MVRYFVFLRGINVSGQKLIKMTELTRIFTEAGFSNIKTYIQSGNVVFDSPETDAETVEMILESALAKSLGYHVDVFLRTADEINQMIEKQPFRGIDENIDIKKYVTFTKPLLPRSIKVPFLSPAGDVEVILFAGNNTFSIAHPAKDGRYGFPNSFMEKTFSTSATTRNWNTVCKMIK